MARYCGVIGYATTVEKSPGVWKDVITERKHYGDVLENNVRWSSTSDSTNDNLSLGNRFSIVADPYAEKNFHSMRYIEFMGTKWKITNITASRPRLIISVGGVYNGGEQA